MKTFFLLILMLSFTVPVPAEETSQGYLLKELAQMKSEVSLAHQRQDDRTESSLESLTKTISDLSDIAVLKSKKSGETADPRRIKIIDELARRKEKLEDILSRHRDAENSTQRSAVDVELWQEAQEQFLNEHRAIDGAIRQMNVVSLKVLLGDLEDALKLQQIDTDEKPISL